MSKQVKISDLKRVVNVDEMTKIASILRNPETIDHVKILNLLHRLDDKTPSKEVLFATKLGFILKDLAKRDDLPYEIRDKAYKIRTKWKNFHKNLLLAQKLDVKCDKPTTEKRQNSRKLLYESIYDDNETNRNADDEFCTNNTQIGDLEFYIFQQCDNLVNLKYFSIVQKCKKLFNENKFMANSYKNGKISVDDLVSKALNAGSQ